MAQTLTPEMLDAAYSFLRTTEPFSKWKLPEALWVDFQVIRSDKYLGFLIEPSQDHCLLSPTIQISDRCCGHTDTLLRAMAHEMIHAEQWYNGKSNRALHNADFKKKAKKVCEAHGWDPKLFV